jgi:flagellar FliJ protein
MAKFRFTLQAVLEQRERLEHDAELALGAAMQKQVTIEQELAGLTQDYYALVESRGGVQFHQGGERLMDFVQYIQKLKYDIAQKKQDLETQKLAVEEARKHLAKRTQDKKAIETLKDGQLAEFKLQEKRAEMKATDESAGQRSLAQKREMSP